MATREAKANAARSGVAMTRKQSDKLREDMSRDPEIDRALKAARKTYPELGRKATSTRDVPRRTKG